MENSISLGIPESPVELDRRNYWRIITAMADAMSKNGYYMTGLRVSRICSCAPGNKELLEVFTDGQRKYATCDICGRTWDADTRKPIYKDGGK